MKIVSRFTTAAAAAMLLASTAGAQVTYSTDFSCTAAFVVATSCAYSNLGVTETINMAGQASTNVSGTPISFVDFGTIALTAPVGGANFVFGAGANLYLRVTQTAPIAGQANWSGILTGTITGSTGSGASVTWSAMGSTTIGTPAQGTTTYGIEAGTPFNAVNSGPQTVRGTVVSTPSTTVPEPSTYALMFAGLAAMGVVARRRRA